VKTLGIRVDDALMEEFEAVCAENHMDATAAANEALRHYVATERARRALDAPDLVALYAEFSGVEGLDPYALDSERLADLS
jgi:hypothetical protein